LSIREGQVIDQIMGGVHTYSRPLKLGYSGAQYVLGAAGDLLMEQSGGVYDVVGE
jgi:hypothetical protein